MRTLVTGGAGFIGSHVLEHLAGLGHTLCVVDNLSRGRTEHVPRTVPLHMADITTAGVERIIADFAPDAIVHLAAQMDVRASVQDPVHDAHVNVLGTVRLLHAAQAHNVKTFVFASSGGAAYGDAQNLPCTEAHPWAPKSPYGASKLCDEIYLETFARSSDLRCVSLRLANVYGPRQSSVGEAGVVAIFAQAMLDGRIPVIFGDGAQTRDYVYVADVAEAVSRTLSQSQVCGTFNIGTGIGTPLVDVAHKLARLTEHSGHLVHAAARAGEVRHSTLDVSLAKKAFGWAPKTSLETGLGHTVAALQQSKMSAAHIDLGAKVRAALPPPQE